MMRRGMAHAVPLRVCAKRRLDVAGVDVAVLAAVGVSSDVLVDVAVASVLSYFSFLGLR